MSDANILILTGRVIGNPATTTTSGGYEFVRFTISQAQPQFNKDTGKVNYKNFDEYQATRTKPAGEFIDGKLETEKYTRTYEIDRATFNGLVSQWWLQKRGIQI